MKKTFYLLSVILVVSLALAACKPATEVPTETPTATLTEPYRITGSFDYTAVDYVLESRWLDHAVALVDMYGFITRDEDWEIPVASQYLGFMAADNEANLATYDLFLPSRPAATFADVDNDGVLETGVQVFTIAYWPNTYGGVYSEGDDRSSGWPAFLASIKTNEEDQYEVTGGKLIVWAPDDQQSFPSGFGEDGMLFTADDPVAPIQAGWTIVDLDQSPFTFSKEAEPELALYQPEFVAEKDFSAMTYTEAFEAMFAFVRQEYAFNGIEGKQPNWDTLYSELKPRVEAAETAGDAEAFYLALRDFTWAFKDGHVGLSGGEIQNNLFMEATGGGYGFAIRELDNGEVVAIYIMAGGPAELAGMEIGAVVTEFNGLPIMDAISAARPWSIQSMDEHIRYQQTRYLLRTQPGVEATVTFANPDEQPRTATLTAIAERDSFAFTSIYRDAPDETYLPIEFTILESGVGYVAIYTNEDDVSLMIKLFERALKTFVAAEAPGIIIDMRYNSGGLPLGLATFLTENDIPMGQTYYYSETTGQFEPEGSPSIWEPMVEQYTFDKMALLVGPACVSACEEESYGFSQVPGMMVIGNAPTSGAFGEVSRGQILLPENFYMQIPTGRFLLPDGSLGLEGVGVPPTVDVPVTLETATSAEDIVMLFAERAILLPLGAGITPSGSPSLMSHAQTEAGLSSADFLEDRAREEYTTEDMLETDKEFTYNIPLSRSVPLMWVWGWCAKDEATLADNLGKMDFTFTLNGEQVSLDSFLNLDYDSSDGQKCTAYILGLTNWPGGEHHLSTLVEFTQALNDGVYDFTPGTQTFTYTVYVKP